jgi:hypothetical protein
MLPDTKMNGVSGVASAAITCAAWPSNDGRL